MDKYKDMDMSGYGYGYGFMKDMKDKDFASRESQHNEEEAVKMVSKKNGLTEDTQHAILASKTFNFIVHFAIIVCVSVCVGGAPGWDGAAWHQGIRLP